MRNQLLNAEGVPCLVQRIGVALGCRFTLHFFDGSVGFIPFEVMEDWVGTDLIMVMFSRNDPRLFAACEANALPVWVEQRRRFQPPHLKKVVDRPVD